MKLIVATGLNNEIGVNNDLLWHLPNDMKFFKKTTKGADVIMGRKTYESIPEKFRPLPGRTNIVITKQKGYKVPPGVFVCHSIEDAVTLAKSLNNDNQFVIGGGEIYSKMLEYVDTIYLTKVDATFDNATAFFPELPSDIWAQYTIDTHEIDTKHKYNHKFICYMRRIK